MKHIRIFFHYIHRYRLIGFAAILFVAILALFGWEKNVLGQSTVVPQGGSGADPYFIQGLKQALSSNRLNNADRQALQNKLAFNERLLAQRAAKQETHGPKGALVLPVPMPQSPVISAPDQADHIIQGSEGMVHSWEANINNLWEGSYHNVHYQVLAGSAPDDLAQGLIILIEYPAGPSKPVQTTYRTPDPLGSLRIVKRQAGRLQLISSNGSDLSFDLETRTFQK